ncbi:MAG: hypothetical protein AB7G93_18935 [Bdellovibrionales bacterium]
MKKSLLATLLMVSAGFTWMASADPCTGESVVENNWFVNVNASDQATREGLLETLDLLATGGFSIHNVFAYPGVSPTKTFLVSYDPSYWVDGPKKANEVKEGVLNRLAEIPGNTIECNTINRPTPAN